MTRRRRTLRPEERALWETVARTATPLRPEDRVQDEPAPEPAAPSAPPLAGEPTGAQRPPAAAKAPPLLNPIERKTLQRLARGTMTIDGRIDLHGMTQHAAHERLRTFLLARQAEGARVVLVITGKGKAEGDDPFGRSERGVLRRAVPLWLSEPAFRQIVVGFDEAHRSHGGGGALYIRIRKRRAPDHEQP